MQNFEALKKPCKPGGVFSPPTSPKIENTTLVLTPEFSQPSPTLSVFHRRAYSRESPQTQKSLIDHYSNENKWLVQRIMQLEHEKENILFEHQKLLHQYNDELKQKIKKWETIIKIKDKNIKELEKKISSLKNENESLKGSPSKFKMYKQDLILECEQNLKNYLDNLSRITEDNAEITGFIANELYLLDQEEFTMSTLADEGYEVSAIQEEGIVLSFGQTEFEPIYISENSIDCNSNKFISTFTSDQLDLQSINSSFSPGNTEIMLLHQIRDKDEEIAKHKEFIKKLKNSLENMLQEHTKSRIEMVKSKLEIKELKEKLAVFG